MKKLFAYSFILLFSSLSGCSYFPAYVPPVQQGNVLDNHQISKIKVGMSIAQVVNILGSPVLINTFRDNQLEYVYTFKSRIRPMILKQFLVYFSGGRVNRIENRYS